MVDTIGKLQRILRRNCSKFQWFLGKIVICEAWTFAYALYCYLVMLARFRGKKGLCWTSNRYCYLSSWAGSRDRYDMVIEVYLVKLCVWCSQMNGTLKPYRQSCFAGKTTQCRVIGRKLCSWELHTERFVHFLKMIGFHAGKSMGSILIWVTYVSGCCIREVHLNCTKFEQNGVTASWPCHARSFSASWWMVS